MGGLWNGKCIDKGCPVLAIVMLDGRVFFDTTVDCHAEVVEKLGLDFASVLDGGYIIGDEFVLGSHDAARLADEARKRS